MTTKHTLRESPLLEQSADGLALKANPSGEQGPHRVLGCVWLDRQDPSQPQAPSPAVHTWGAEEEAQGAEPTGQPLSIALPQDGTWGRHLDEQVSGGRGLCAPRGQRCRTCPVPGGPPSQLCNPCQEQIHPPRETVLDPQIPTDVTPEPTLCWSQ